jgi:hypothetical protein
MVMGGVRGRDGQQQPARTASPAAMASHRAPAGAPEKLRWQMAAATQEEEAPVCGVRGASHPAGPIPLLLPQCSRVSLC